MQLLGGLQECHSVEVSASQRWAAWRLKIAGCKSLTLRFSVAPVKQERSWSWAVLQGVPSLPLLDCVSAAGRWFLKEVEGAWQQAV